MPAYYSTGSNLFQITQPSPQVTGSGNVTAGLNASDGDFSTFAVLRTDATATLGKPVGLRLQLTGEAPAGYRAGVLLANASGLLSLNALGTVTLRTYLSGATPELREEKVVRADLVRASLLATDRPTQLEFSSSKSFDAVEIEIGGLVGVSYTTNIYYAYGVQPGVQTRAAGYLSQFAAPTSAEFNTRDYTGLACVLTDVDNPERVADFDLTNFATFRSVLTVDCQPSLRTKLAGVPASGVPAGHYAGFVVGQAGLLDAGVLSGLRVSTYRNGVLQESRTGTGLLELNVLPGGKAQVSFPTTLPFDEVGISRTGLLTAVDNLNVYYGFGLQPQFFEGLNPVLTDTTAPTSPEQYLASAPQTISLVGLGLVTLSQVVDPENAADGILTNFAQLNTTGLGLITGTTRASLRLKLNGTGRAGNRVGVVIQQGAGLLDLAALQRLTLLTYDADKNLIETKTGSDLLTVSLLAGSTDKFKVSFLATRDFQYVALEVNSAASISSNTRVFYGFAEDIPLFSFAAPLPVELSAFTGRWANGAADLNWATASEKNSSHFVVERSTGKDAGFQAIGQVQSVGNSSRTQTYTLRDQEAATQGVAILYYRLRQVDVDGKQAFSPVVSVKVNQRISATRLEVYPNPASDVRSVMIRLQDLPAGSTVQTYSPLGQLVSQMPVTGAGATRLVLPATLAPGMYHVVLRGANGQALSTQRLAVEGR
ncbi:hypothetical protein BEN47_04995 [Hymenobacter lapidarius]|uniref:Secretion system C-terminal sorting domain-containing protein n=1 Tax=Hymenobacter lapidarius TaxID=1908237 RepID=A0A1G1STP2_9BACT|nr:T9SS type A sorting domain-containing protein [Hymenobacter lapidarius]OGX81979.1 hypothetical protein BEN47_04995 [Hymenobacter lapidarius]